MARHPFSPRAGRRNRNRTYTILLGVLVICVMIAFYYGPFGKNEAETIDTNTQNDTNANIRAVTENTTSVKNIITVTISRGKIQIRIEVLGTAIHARKTENGAGR